jgi:tetratricopeptide (TPR) repeat protein
MNGNLSIALVLACGLALAPHLFAQEAAAQEAQKPAAGATQTAPTSNPFPEDTGTVPVMPSTATQQSSSSEEEAAPSTTDLPLSGKDADPVHSPDDLADDSSNDQSQGESASSSLKNLEDLLPKDSDRPDKKKKLTVKEPTRKESAAKDIEVGGYYLEKKDWKAALSRYQSALVLDPENPNVYWGLAESERHLNQFADARAHYLQLLDYDPDGPHGKQARKAIKDPEVANGKNAAMAQTPTAAATEPAK